MRTSRKTLTKTMVEKAEPAKFGTMVWDGRVPGFGCRVFPGKRVYVFVYRTPRGTQRTMSLGRHGALTVEQAREFAEDAYQRVRKGGDPVAEAEAKRAAARAEMTVAELAGLYLAQGPAEKPNKKASSWITDRSNIERHIKPLLGRITIAALAASDVAKFQVDVATGRSKADSKTDPTIKTKKRGRAIIEGGRGTAARSLAVLGAMLQFGVARKLIQSNPAKGVRLLKLAPKERFLSEAEVARLADTLAVMEAEGRISTTATAAIRLLLLSGCRKSEILNLRWEWVDFDRSCLRLPDSKTGAKVVPLASAALDLLVGLPRADAAFVLPAARGEGHYTGLQKDWERVRMGAGLPGLRIHDLRHSFASFAIADGHSLFLIGKVLGHKQARTTEGYAHLAADPLRAVADKTAARITAAMKASAAKAQETHVVPFRPAAG